MLQLLKSAHPRARALQQRVAPAHRIYRKPVRSNEDPMQPKLNKLNKLILKKENQTSGEALARGPAAPRTAAPPLTLAGLGG